MAPNPKQQRSAQQQIQNLFQEPSTVYAIHYSCESFHDRPEGRSPRITSIAIANLSTQQAESFSIHKRAERERILFSCIENHYDDLESAMLQDFFSYLKQYQQTKYLHWNMRDDNYGFQAIEHRYRVLTKNVDLEYRVPESQKFDLALLLKQIYGPTYIEHPRMYNLLNRNNNVPPGFLSGLEEATAFEEKEYNRLHQSSIAKVHAITTVANLAYNQELKTNTSFWQMRGGRARAVASWPLEHPKMSSLYGLVSAVVALGACVLS